MGVRHQEVPHTRSTTTASAVDVVEEPHEVGDLEGVGEVDRAFCPLPLQRHAVDTHNPSLPAVLVGEPRGAPQPCHSHLNLVFRPSLVAADDHRHSRLSIGLAAHTLRQRSHHLIERHHSLDDDSLQGGDHSSFVSSHFRTPSLPNGGLWHCPR